MKEKKSGLGTLDFFSIGFGAVIGAGWGVSINRWMASCGGPIPASVGYLVALVMMIPIALCYCELVPMLPVAGGGMAFSYRAFGKKVAFITGWATFGAFVTLVPWEAIYVTDVLSVLLPFLKAGTPLYRIAGYDVYLSNIIVGLLFTFILFYFNKKGIGTAAILQKYLCLVLVGSGVIGMIAALFKFNPQNFIGINSGSFYENVGVGFHHNFLGGVMGIMVSAPFFLCGFETIPQAVEEAGGKISSVGKTVVASVGLACLFYAALLFCFGSAMPWQEFAKVASPAGCELFHQIYPGAVGNILYFTLLVGILAGLFTTWNGFFMASALQLMAMARVSLVPKFFAEQNKDHVPLNALILVLVIGCFGPFLGLGLIDPLTSFSGAAYMLTWGMAAVCLIRLRKTEPNLKRPLKIPGGLLTAWFSASVSLIIFILMFIPNNPVYMGKMPVALFIGWMALGLILYLANMRERKQSSEEERQAILFAKMER